MKNYHIDYIFFDLDNTIVDSLPFIIECYKYSFSKMKKEFITDEIDSMLGPPEDVIFRRVFKSKEKIKNAISYFRYYYAKNYKKEIHIYPQMNEVLRELVNSYNLSLVTGATRKHLESVLDLCDIRDIFGSSIVTSDDVSFYKPNPECLYKAMDMVHADVSNSIYIGDSVLDFYLAKNIGIKFIGASWGYKGVNSIEKSDCLHVYEIYTLKDVIDNLYK
jgi:HAD superfamily hydrolase (TIGR01549 family)